MDKNKIKLLFIIPNLKGGGAERVLVNLLNQVDYQQYKVDLYLGVKQGDLVESVPKSVSVKSIYPSNFIFRLSIFLYHRLGTEFLMSFYGKKIRGDYDTGICFLDGAFAQHLFSNSSIIRKRVTVIHSSYSSYGQKKKFIKGKHRIRMLRRFSALDTIVSVSYESMKEFKELFGVYKDMRVIYNPINAREVELKSMAPVEKAWPKKQKTTNLLAVGSLLPVKGYENLIQACVLLKERKIPFHLSILGDGPLKEKLENLITKLDLANCITLLGFSPNPYSYLKLADIFVMTSECEGLPTALCEALVLHKPTLVTNVPGCREVVENGKFGMMVERGPIKIANGLQSLIENKGLQDYYSQMARERAKAFNDDVAMKNYSLVFENNLKNESSFCS